MKARLLLDGVIDSTEAQAKTNRVPGAGERDDLVIAVALAGWWASRQG